MKQNIRFEILVASLCILATAGLWQMPWLLSIALLGLAVFFIVRSPHAHPIKIFIGAGIGGAVSEIIAISAGAWTYALPQVFTIPLWLPILWGNAALFIVAIALRKRNTDSI
ncbi:MAG: hypothetical protein WAZ27_00215 [Minisyncoccia bacterium]